MKKGFMAKALTATFLVFALGACSQSVGPNGIKQQFGPWCQSVGPDGVKQGSCDDASVSGPSCSVECDGEKYQTRCYKNQTPVCQCESKPQAYCK
ncbi:MAG: hypothetical protein OXT49_04315 [Gammaproteobacteria bacterium]|nr:hypothetical protein [Gammaproteobacteria bacterium]